MIKLSLHIGRETVGHETRVAVLAPCPEVPCRVSNNTIV